MWVSSTPASPADGGRAAPHPACPLWFFLGSLKERTAAWVGSVQLKRDVCPWLGGEATDRQVGSGLARGLHLWLRAGDSLAPCCSTLNSPSAAAGLSLSLCSSDPAPGLSPCGQELSLVLTVLNWALAARLWCFRFSLPLGLPEGLNKHKLKDVDVWWTISY